MSEAPNSPTLALTLDWEEGLRFRGQCGAATIVLDSAHAGQAGPTPVQALAFSLAGCMGIDVVDILRKGRHPLKGLQVRLEAVRSAADPRRLTAVRLQFVVAGAVPPGAVERALQLSRDKYCSVWNSLRQDIDFRTSYDVQPEP